MNAETPRTRAARDARLSLPAAIAIAMGVAFAAGLLLFALLYFSQRTPTLPEDRLASPERARSTESVSALPAPQPSARAPVDAGTAAREPAPADAEPWTEVPPVAPAPPAAASPDGIAAEPAPGDGASRPPVPVRTPEPDFPRAALRRGESGEVLLAVRVDARGRPQEVGVARSSGHPALDRAAVRAVRRWRFEPALRDGTPVADEVRIPVAFVAEGR